MSSAMSTLSEFKPTSIDSIPAIVDKVRDSFLSQKTKPVEYRLAQLRNLYWA